MYGGPGTGIGPALRKARQARGMSIEEASRDTHIRQEYLQALEREAFGSLRGDVYVRGFLRSYSSYLGLNPDKVVGVYVQAMGGSVEDVPEPPPVRPTQQQTLRKVLYRRGNWALAGAIAIVALVVAGAIGVLSQGGSVPAPAATLPSSTDVSALPLDASVTAEIHAVDNVDLNVIVDGQPVFTGTLEKGATRTFTGADLIKVTLATGKVAQLVVNGQALGTPGKHDHPFTASFGPQDFRTQESSSASGG